MMSRFFVSPSRSLDLFWGSLIFVTKYQIPSYMSVCQSHPSIITIVYSTNIWIALWIGSWINMIPNTIWHHQAEQLAERALLCWHEDTTSGSPLLSSSASHCKSRRSHSEKVRNGASKVQLQITNIFSGGRVTPLKTLSCRLWAYFAATSSVWLIILQNEF
jgi:hypothetical protein